ncbi:MAG TPA: endolytic transglycosylase MltG [Burkholderiales bacterium]|jgi:conserved hypothetical protein, YceG family
MSLKRTIKRGTFLLFAISVAAAGWFAYWALSDLPLAHAPLEFGLKTGSSLRSASRQMVEAGVLREPLRFELLARLLGESANLKAGNYELKRPLSALELLRKITSDDYTEVAITLVEGWSFRHVRQALEQNDALDHRTRGWTEAEILRQLGAEERQSAEGLFFPETYYFSTGETDMRVLRRAYRLMQQHLEREWARRSPDLPLTTPYEALILASLVEKETGKPEDRAMVAAVFVNRLKLGMRLQTDPTVIYGLGEQFDGNLRKRDLRTDHAYNTYTRTGMPPTPIAMPGLAALRAALHPANSDALYFVAKGDGQSHFSRTLEEHERAVTRWQRR